MAVDRGYGTGSARSAVNSRNRRRAAAGQLSKSKKGNTALKRIAAENPITGFIPGGGNLGFALPVNKVLNAAKSLQAAGRAAEAAPLFARVAAKVGGRVAKKASVKGNAGRGPFSMKNAFKEQSAVKTLTGRNITSQGAREASESVFPRLPSGGGVPGAARTFDKYYDALDEGAGRFARGTKRGNQLVKAIEKNEVQQGFYVGQREAVKRAAFNSKVKPFPIPKRGR